jgi:hypothetical protein
MSSKEHIVTGEIYFVVSLIMASPKISRIINDLRSYF